MIDTRELEELFHPTQVDHFTQPDGEPSVELTFENRSVAQACATHVIAAGKYEWALFNNDGPGYGLFLCDPM